ncbi:MAG: hypothetical protein JWQ98_3053 [Chlorobi bacterium]|nr:hypothetical protein [Chlorobiota bacterium]
MNRTHLALLVTLLFSALHVGLRAQSSGDSVGSGRFGYLRQDGPSASPRVPPRTSRAGAYIGLTVDYMSLGPSAVAPDLGGTPVLIGEEGLLLLNGLMVGGAGGSAHLYNANPATYQFTYSYAGVLLGYEFSLSEGRNFYLQSSVLVGGGGLTAIRRRPELSVTAAGTILEEVRNQNYFLLRPQVVMAYMPSPIASLGVSAGYVVPVGGGSTDFKSLTIGLRLMLGFSL